MLIKQSVTHSQDSRQRIVASKSLLLGIAFSALIIYELVGIFPIAPVEGDGLGIANGATQIATVGLEGTTLAYRYNVQSGTYAITVLLHTITGLDTFAILSLLSALASILFVLVSAALLSRITTYSIAACGLVLLLFQEAFTSGYYANSTVIAAVFFVTAFWVVTYGDSLPRLILSGILLGLGAWMRFDLLLVTPAILPLLHRGTWKRTIIRTSIIAAVTGMIALAALYLSGSGLQHVLASASSHRASQGGTRTNLNLLLESMDIRSHATFYTPLLGLLILIGIVHLVRKRGWLTLGISLLGIVPFYAVYLGAITTPKYLYYLIPFAALLALSAFPTLKPLFAKQNLLRRSILLILLILFIAQYVIGWQFSSPARPYLRESYPNFLTLFSTATPVSSIERISLVVGAGSSLSTPDGRRLLSGLAFAPLFQSHEKSLINAEVERFNQYLDMQETNLLYVLTTQYGSQQLLLNQFLRAGYACQAEKDVPEQNFNQFTCMRDGKEIHLATGEIATLSTEQANHVIEAMIAAVQTPNIVFVSTNPLERNLLLERAEASTQINDFAHELELATKGGN